MKLAMFVFLMSLTTAVAFASPLAPVEQEHQGVSDNVYMTCELNLESLKSAADNNLDSNEVAQQDLESEWIVWDSYQRLSTE